MTNRFDTYYYIHNLDDDLYEALRFSAPNKFKLDILSHKLADLAYYALICTDLERALDMRDTP